MQDPHQDTGPEASKTNQKPPVYKIKQLAKEVQLTQCISIFCFIKTLILVVTGLVTKFCDIQRPRIGSPIL
jgi:hypothetical protein